MPGPHFHLAQFNIAKALVPLDDPQLADFVARLAEVNASAEASPGFVWRLKDDSGNATSIREYPDPKILVNMSVWESIEQLQAFVYQGKHMEVFKQRGRWFARQDPPSQVLWWIPAGHLPDAAEGKARLAHLAGHGPSAKAFTFSNRFPAPEMEEAAAL